MRPALRVVEGGGRRSSDAARHRRRRLALAAVVAALVVVAAWYLGNPSATDPSVGGGPSAGAEQVVHVVRPGDTIWSIAAEIAPGTDVRATVDRLVAANGGAPLVVGQRLVLEA
ncbi:MAG: LysM peptidoglycan-binding domain-containing protein [Acidimicrobiia bacterium]